MLTEIQWRIMKEQRALVAAGIHRGDRRFYWLSRIGEDGLPYREYYSTAAQVRKRALELAGIKEWKKQY